MEQQAPITEEKMAMFCPFCHEDQTTTALLRNWVSEARWCQECQKHYNKEQAVEMYRERMRTNDAATN